MPSRPGSAAHISKALSAEEKSNIRSFDFEYFLDLFKFFY